MLARGAKLSIFDEPEAGIDLWSFQNLIQTFDSMRRSIPNSSFLIISHQERILNIADEIIVLSNGRIEQSGDKEKIMAELSGTASAVPGCRKVEGGSGSVC